MDHEKQTWIKSDEGNFIQADMITHIMVNSVTGRALVYVVSGQHAGTFSSAGSFFAALQNGIGPEDFDG